MAGKCVGMGKALLPVKPVVSRVLFLTTGLTAPISWMP